MVASVPRVRSGRRRLMSALLVGAAVLGLVSLPAPGVRADACGAEPSGLPGTFTCSWYPAPGVAGARQYWLYVPPHPHAGMPVIVYLHGCTQTALIGAAESRFDVLARAHGFIAVYPQQTVTPNSSAPAADGNGAGCWNWFLPQDQAAGSGEPATLAGITENVLSTYRADPRRVFVDGVSAGADMAGILGATYPHLYAAVAAMAGCAYATCSDTTGRLAFQAMGQAPRAMPVFVEQGTADTLNAYPLGAGLVEQWLATDNLASGGKISPVPASTANYGFDQTPSPGSGDPCIQASNFPCLGGVVGFQRTYPYTVSQWADSRGCDVIDFWTIHGLEHAYPDAPTTATFSDPLGPDITTAVYDFFMAHPMVPSACAPTGAAAG